MWRNRQTRRIQVPVVVNTLWVQVPSSAPNKKGRLRRLFYLVHDLNEGGNPYGFPLRHFIGLYGYGVGYPHFLWF